MSTGASTSESMLRTAAALPRIETLSGMTFTDSTCSPACGSPVTETLTGMRSPTISSSNVTATSASCGETETRL